MKKTVELHNLLTMLREIDTNKNTREDLKMIINWIADAMEEELRKGE